VCAAARYKKWADLNPGAMAARSREGYARDPGKAADEQRKYRAENKVKVQLSASVYRERNKEQISEYGRTYNKVNSARLSAISKENYARNPEKYLSAAKKWAQENPDKVLAKGRRWGKANPDKLLAKCARRRARLASTPWANKKEIAEIFSTARKMAKLQGVAIEVDHIFPLHGATCSGLHVAANLQPIAAAENRSKKNKLPGQFAELLWDPTGPDVYHSPTQ